VTKPLQVLISVPADCSALRLKSVQLLGMHVGDVPDSCPFDAQVKVPADEPVA
jgi:hypothetical protein